MVAAFSVLSLALVAVVVAETELASNVPESGVEFAGPAEVALPAAALGTDAILDGLVT